jgi:Tol biopolymer transport system component
MVSTHVRSTATVLSFIMLQASCTARDERRAGPETVYAESPPVWFEAHRLYANIAPNGRVAALPLRWPLSVRTIDLEKHAEASSSLAAIVDSARNATFMANGEPVVLGWRGGTMGWYTKTADSVELLAIPANAWPSWSSDGKQVAFAEVYARQGDPEHAVIAGPIASPRRYAVAGRVTDVAWLPGDEALLVMLSDSLGAAALVQLNLASGETVVRVRDLDADPASSPIALSPDGRRVFVALSRAGAPRPEERHRPNADRDADIYEIVLATGAKRTVVATAWEETAPVVVNGDLYWTQTAIDMSVVVLPIEGGEVRPIVPGAFLPSWRPDGKAVGFVYGGFVGADWVLNWEGGLVDVDSTTASPTSAVQGVITGYHEDFQPVWSPNGEWIAYHSHRSPTPVPLYAWPGATDDIWVRRAGSTEEIRLTDYGWEVGSPDWSRDGRQLLFTGWLRPDKGEGRGTYAAIVTIDPSSGRAVSHNKIPLGPIPSAEMATWSPTGREIAIEGISKPGVHSIWIVRPDGSSARKLVEHSGQTYGGLDWLPDGSALVYSALVDGHPQLFVVPTGGGTPRQLTRENASMLHPQISPDGRHIAATRIVQSKEIRRMPLP